MGLLSVQQRGQIAAAIENAFNPDGFAQNPKQNDVTSDYRQTGVFADLRSKLVRQRLVPDLTNLFADLADERDCAEGIIVRDEVGDSF